jgi:hypothetical protein
LGVLTGRAREAGTRPRNLPEVVARYLPGLESDAQRALQVVRSTPGIGTALVGMTTPMAWEQFRRMFSES